MDIVDTTDSRAAIGFLERAIKDFTGLGAGAKVLDFGCGYGGLVGSLLERGYDAYGCDLDNEIWNGGDMARHWQAHALVDPARLGVIRKSPYRLPYDDNTFDVVLSTSVLEHALNKEEIFREIHRILKPAGMSLHILPSKWYLPLEPHVDVPLLNFIWPYCPKWWFYFWAFLGVKAPVQKGTWREIAEWNQWYFKTGLSYWTHAALRRLSMRVFNNYQAPMRYFMEHSVGGAAALGRRLPFPSLTAWLLGHLRMFFIVSYKEPAPQLAPDTGLAGGTPSETSM
jgi:SAM-dependent methyltransferase